MHKFGDFQSVFQLSVAISLVAEWADPSSIGKMYVNRVRRRMQMRLLRVKKYVPELEGFGVMDPEDHSLYEGDVGFRGKGFAANLVTFTLRGILLYSGVMLLVSSFEADAQLSTQWAIPLVVPVLIPGLVFLFAYHLSYGAASKNREKCLKAMIRNAEQALDEYENEHAPLTYITYVNPKGKSMGEGMGRYLEAKAAYDTKRDNYVRQRILEFESEEGESQ